MDTGTVFGGKRSSVVGQLGLDAPWSNQLALPPMLTLTNSSLSNTSGLWRREEQGHSEWLHRVGLIVNSKIKLCVCEGVNCKQFGERWNKIETGWHGKQWKVDSKEIMQIASREMKEDVWYLERRRKSLAASSHCCLEWDSRRRNSSYISAQYHFCSAKPCISTTRQIQWEPCLSVTDSCMELMLLQARASSDPHPYSPCLLGGGAQDRRTGDTWTTLASLFWLSYLTCVPLAKFTSRSQGITEQDPSLANTVQTEWTTAKINTARGTCYANTRGEAQGCSFWKQTYSWPSWTTASPVTDQSPSLQNALTEHTWPSQVRDFSLWPDESASLIEAQIQRTRLFGHATSLGRMFSPPCIAFTSLPSPRRHAEELQSLPGLWMPN